MNTFIFPLLMGAPQAGADQALTGGSLIGSFLPIIAIIAIFYFLIIRPQNKKRKETEKMHAGLKKGDKVVTIGGLYGTIHSVKDTTVILKADDNVKLEFLRSAISSITSASPKEEKIEEKNEEKDKEKPDNQKSEEKASKDGE